MKRYWQTAIEGVKAGDRIMVDEGFTCIKPYSVVTVKDDRPWWKFWGEPELYFSCTGDEDGGVGPNMEKHFLDGQIDSYEVESSGGHMQIDVYVGIVPEYTGWCYLIWRSARRLLGRGRRLARGTAQHGTSGHRRYWLALSERLKCAKHL